MARSFPYTFLLGSRTSCPPPSSPPYTSTHQSSTASVSLSDGTEQPYSSDKCKKSLTCSWVNDSNSITEQWKGDTLRDSIILTKSSTIGAGIRPTGAVALCVRTLLSRWGGGLSPVVISSAVSYPYAKRHCTLTSVSHSQGKSVPDGS